MNGGKIRRGGVTLVELIVTLGLIAIMALAAVPLLSDPWERRAEAEIARLESLINHARSLAYSRHCEFAVIFDIDADSVTVSRGLLGRAGMIANEDDYVWELEEGILVKAEFDGAERLCFNKRGETLKGGIVQVRYENLVKQLTIETVTGAIRVEEARL